jgi:DNA invertase Pin-like site-specific DNA recombinase
MLTEFHQKVTADHLRRDAYLYVRQSTLRQVLENAESTKRQYALRERAAALGWPAERIVVVDCDLGQSGASAVDREGFQRLVAEVGLGHVGIVLGLEVSRLARSSVDWHRLLEICGLTATLILDEDGVYDPMQCNDRLLLGLKGTMSEAELHVLRARMRGGLINKARRGELKTPLPIGFVYGPGDHAIRISSCSRRCGCSSSPSAERDPLGERCGSSAASRSSSRGGRSGVRTRGSWSGGPCCTVRCCTPCITRGMRGPSSSAVRAGTKPSAAATASTRSRTISGWPASRTHTPDTSPWEEHQDNLRRLAANAQAHGRERRKSPPREGVALLQGLVVCGRCGNRMTVRYHQRDGRLVPEDICQREMVEAGAPRCQSIPAARLDGAVGDLLVAAVSPLALDAALAVQEELAARAEEADRLRCQQVERARYQADLAKRR